MPGTLLVKFVEARDVYVDSTKCGFTEQPFDVEIGTHDIDLGAPSDYSPPFKKVRVKAIHSPLAPLVVTFTPKKVKS